MKYINIFAIIIIAFPIHAQIKEVKLNIAVNYYWLESPTQEMLFPNSKGVKFENGDYGFDVGYGIGYSIGSKLSGSTDLNYSNRYRNEFDPEGTQQTVKYIGIQQKFYYHILKILRPNIGVGVNYLTLKRSIADRSFDSDEFFFNSYDIAIIFGLAVRIKSVELFGDFGYGLNPQRIIFEGRPDVKLNSKSRLLRLGLSYVIEGKGEKEKGRNKKRKRKR